MPENDAIFVFEPHGASLKHAETAIEALDHKPLSAATTEEAMAILEGVEPVAFIISWGTAGQEIANYLRDFSDVMTPIVALVDAAEQDPQQAVEAMDADGYLRQPCTASALEAFLSVGLRLTELRSRWGSSERALAETRTKLENATTKARTGFHHFEAVKDLLIVEVRRAKRYGYPLAILMVGLDPVPASHELNHPSLQREVTAGLALAISKSIRVIDIPIHYADDRILVFLPHTDQAGADEVGRRIKRRLKRITYRGDGVVAELTASVGVAGISSGESKLTFSKLIRAAASALKAAQLKGGDKVMKRVSAHTD